MNSSSRVTVCLLTCNHVRYIRRCLDSVVSQFDDLNVEVIVGDDCSDDGTSDIVADYALRFPGAIQHIRRGKRLGGSENYMDVLRRASAPYIAHLDGDDAWLPGKLKQQIAILDADAGCSAVYSNAVTIAENGERIGMFNSLHGERIDISYLVCKGNFLCNSSMLFRAALLPRVFSVVGPVLDYRMHLLFAEAGHLVQIAEPLVEYRVNSVGSMVSQANNLVRTLYWEAVLSAKSYVDVSVYQAGIIDFLRRVIFRVARTRQWQILREWFPRVYAESPAGIAWTSMLLALAVVSKLTTLTFRAAGRMIGFGDKILYQV